MQSCNIPSIFGLWSLILTTAQNSLGGFHLCNTVKKNAGLAWIFHTCFEIITHDWYNKRNFILSNKYASWKNWVWAERKIYICVILRSPLLTRANWNLNGRHISVKRAVNPPIFSLDKVSKIHKNQIKNNILLIACLTDLLSIKVRLVKGQVNSA